MFDMYGNIDYAMYQHMLLIRHLPNTGKYNKAEMFGSLMFLISLKKLQQP
jgi:hypothetical protein